MRALGINVKALEVRGCIPSPEAVRFNVQEFVKVALGGCRVGQSDLLRTAGGCNSAASALFAGCTGCRGRFQGEGDVFIALLEDEDRRSEVAGLGCLVWRELLDGGVDQEDIGQVIELLFGGVGLLVDIAAESQVPPLVGPIAIASAAM